MLRKPKITELAQEWHNLTEQALAIAKRKREMREVLEFHIEAMMPWLNEELKNLGLKYRFSTAQSAGYTVEGPLSLRLYPRYIGNFSPGLVDYRRAKELTEIVLGTKPVQEFLTAFPHIRIEVECNCYGNERALPSIRKKLASLKKVIA